MDRTPRVVVITGAAGGLGKALVDEFSKANWRVVAAQHRAAVAGSSEALWPLTVDVTDAASADQAVGAILDRWDRIDAWINNAGVTADAPLARMTEAEWDRVLAVNLRGVFLGSRAALRPMLHQHDGHIVNVSSFSGRVGARGQANYAAAKAGLLAMTQSLAKEVGSRNVRVNAVLPGVLPTPMTAALGAQAMEAFAKANALGRINSVEEVARFIGFLVTTRNISGQIFQLDSRMARWT